MNYVVVHELTERDNFIDSIYEEGWKGRLVARCNQNGQYPEESTIIVEALNRSLKR